MFRSHRCFRATHLLSLICLLSQVPQSSAYPYLQGDSRPEVIARNAQEDNAQSANVVYQINDGQIQYQPPPPQYGSPPPQYGPPAPPAIPTTTVVVPCTTSSKSPATLSSSTTTSVIPRDVTTSTSTSLGPAYPAPSSSTTSEVIDDPASLTPSASTTTRAPQLEPSVPSDAAPSSSPTSITEIDPAIPGITSPSTGNLVVSTTTPSSSEQSATTMPPVPTNMPDNSLTSLSPSDVQTGTVPDLSSTGGSVITSLQTSGQPSSEPFPDLSFSTTSLSLVDPTSFSSPTATAPVTSISETSIFRAIATGAPPSQISQRSDHPVPRLGIQGQQEKLQTNKFYSNLFLGDQSQSVFTFPYSVQWTKGSGETPSWGLAVSHVERNQVVFGPPQPGKDAGQSSYYANPIGVRSLILSATELNQTEAGTPGLTTDSLAAFSINLNLFGHGWTTPTIVFPLVQGSPFITGKYNSATPLIQTGVGIDNITYAGAVIEGSTYKYRIRLRNGYTWLMYVSPQSTGYAQNTFTLSDGAVQGASSFSGTIQVAKLPGDANSDVEAVYDSAAGAYPITGAISGAVDGTVGSYTMSWTKEGVSNQTLLLFALPHHVGSFSDETAGRATGLQLMTTVKGMATAVRGDSWTLTEDDLPIDMAFAPWSPAQGSVKTVSSNAVQAIYEAGLAELQQRIGQQTNVGSLYFDGKALAKFAAIVYTMNDIAGNRTLALSGLKVLQDAMAFHINNQMGFPLVYESAWGGVVSSGAYQNGNALEDFGNTYYNDHHFHYGYFVYTAAVIGYLDNEWLNDSNVAWTNMLVRDYANSVTDDEYFPFSRAFDWYHGHSWAAGLFASADGKNQESSSEDTMASYALKMWGQIINDKAMEARGNLMLAIQKRSFAAYYLFEETNTVQPAEYIGNKVAGILFENKMDHTTYFGAAPELIEGIHMIPLMPFSAYIRSAKFVQEEWDAYFANTINTIQSGWRGLLMANFAIVNPSASFNFFSDPNLNPDFLDGGASQTWYLAWSAALGGSGT
ncbi:unnamed protein product [Zymoseptoria tritici ST99CH_3D1]|nr:unnamed protein product [Zymoseptoria tritici ST99CH_3D1]